LSGVVLLHGWPGAPSDYDEVIARLGDACGPVLVPDLFAPRDPDASSEAFAQRVLAGMRSAGLERPVVVGYDIGSRIAQALALAAPEALAGLVLAPPYSGIGRRPLEPDHVGEAWYRFMHRLPVADAMLDGNRDAIHAYLTHFWTHWAAPGADLTSRPAFADVIERYAQPGAMTAGFEWYRQNGSYAGDAPVTVPTRFLWPDEDPLFPAEWADALDDWFTDVQLEVLPGVGHFVPLEAPDAVVDAVRALASAA
jgi:pimeloyl-ACP methyl ester carboxylesterase